MRCGILEEVEFNYNLSMENNKVKENIHKIFENWNETIIWSCLQGIMGEIYTNVSEDAAMAILGDFAFYAGNPSEELVKYKPESCKQDFIIMVPQNNTIRGSVKRGGGRICSKL